MTGSERLVLDPDVAFRDVENALSAWRGGALDRTARLGGEPVAARWTRDGAEVRWSANPAIGLRVLEGSAAAGLEGLLPLLTPDRAVELACSSDPGDALLGVTALGLLEDVTSLPVLAELAASPEPAVRGAAELASRRIGLAVLAAGAERVAMRRQHHPDRDPVLGLVQPVSARRQVLRQVLADPPADRTRLMELVAAALADEDWEVRWSAVLGADRHRLAELLPALRHCPTPGFVGSGIREILEAVRDVVGHRLVGRPSQHPGAARVGALLEGDNRLRDLPFLLVTALRTPVPDTPDARPGFAHVPAVPHWLGGPQHGVRLARLHAFEIAAATEPDVLLAELPGRLRVLSRVHGVALRLPTPDELEAATRGPDARRYPWGNGRERKVHLVASAWGLAQPLIAPEWVQTPTGPMAVQVPRYGFGESPVPASSASLRPVVYEAGPSRSSPTTPRRRG
jgi:hypothetical protein